MYYDRGSGWTGRTYSEASRFCHIMHTNFLGADSYGLCLYDALCPLGQYAEPLGGYTRACDARDASRNVVRLILGMDGRNIRRRN